MSGYRTCTHCGERRRDKSFAVSTKRWLRKDGTYGELKSRRSECNFCRAQKASTQARLRKQCSENAKISKLIGWPAP